MTSSSSNSFYLKFHFATILEQCTFLSFRVKGTTFFLLNSSWSWIKVQSLSYFSYLIYRIKVKQSSVIYRDALQDPQWIPETSDSNLKYIFYTPFLLLTFVAFRNVLSLYSMADTMEYKMNRKLTPNLICIWKIPIKYKLNKWLCYDINTLQIWNSVIWNEEKPSQMDTKVRESKTLFLHLRNEHK